MRRCFPPLLVPFLSLQERALQHNFNIDHSWALPTIQYLRENQTNQPSQGHQHRQPHNLGTGQTFSYCLQSLIVSVACFGENTNHPLSDLSSKSDAHLFLFIDSKHEFEIELYFSRACIPDHLDHHHTILWTTLPTRA